MTLALTAAERKAIRRAFRMPSVQTMTSRKSSITNAFVNAIIPVIRPSIDEIAKALDILGMSPDDVRCAYCGDKSTEWDHLRPLVVNRRPTGFISEIGNLVPACAKCNQSKRNENWLSWMLGSAENSPASRNVPDLEARIKRLKAFESWKQIEPIPFEEIIGSAKYCDYWQMMDRTIASMKACQVIADEIKLAVARVRGVLPAVDQQPASKGRLNQAVYEKLGGVESEKGASLPTMDG